MRFNFQTTAAAVVSLFAIGALGTCAPATAVWAKDGPIQIGSTRISSLLPSDVLAQAVVEGNSLTAPVLVEPGDDLFEDGLSQNDTKAPRRAKSLAELAKRHAATSTPNREAECLAGAIYFESKGEPLDGQLAVAQVILNRAKSGRFPGSVCGVVFQPSQFSFVRGGGFPPIARSSAQWKTAVAVAHIAQNGLWESSVANALFFHATHVSPGWRLKRLASLGNHVFYR